MRRTKIIAAMLSLVFVFMLFPSLRVNADIASGTCGANGDNLTWVLDDNGTLTISGSGDMADYEYYKDPTSGNWRTSCPWYEQKDSIKAIVIGDGITTIGVLAFRYLSNLESVTISNSVTSIGDWAFGDCYSLTSIIIPNSVTIIGVYAFYNCTNITSITIPNSVTFISDYAFEDCTNLTEVTMTQVLYDSIDSSLVFYGINPTINKLPSGYCGDPSVNGGKDVTWIFDDTTGTLTISGTGDMMDCISNDPFLAIYKDIKTVIINDGVTSIGDGAFRHCKSLTGITIPNSVTSIGDYAFYNCTNLTSITIPNSVTSIGDSAFQDCTSLTDVAMSKVLYDDLVQKGTLNYVFYNITLPSIHFSYIVDYKSNGNGTITGTTKSFGTDLIELTITPDTGYEIDKVTWSDGTNPDVELTATNGKYTMPDSEAGTVTITVSFKPIEYNISFVNEDGTVLQSSSVPYGDTPAYTGATPTKAADAQYTYTFSGWDPAITTVTGDATYTAVFNKTAITTNTPAVTTTPAPGTYYVQSIEEKDGAIVITIKRTENDDQTYELVQSIETDGKQLSVGDQIELTSGSAIITIKKDFVSTLTPGTHTMKVTFKDGGSITLEYTVKEPEKAQAAVQATGEATAITAFIGIGLILTACGIAVITLRKRKEEA